MVGRGNPFNRNYFMGDSCETKFLGDFISEERVGSEEEGLEHLYAIPFEEFNHLRIHTRYYIKQLGGLRVIAALPRRWASRKVPTYNEDLILVENLKELVKLSI